MVFFAGEKIQGNPILPQLSEVYNTYRSARKTPQNVTINTTTVGLQADKCNT